MHRSKFGHSIGYPIRSTRGLVLLSGVAAQERSHQAEKLFPNGGRQNGELRGRA